MTTLQPTPFKVSFTDEQLNRLKEKVRLGDLAKPTYEGSGKAPLNLGVKSEWMKKAKEHWANGYDWHVFEEKINKHSHFTAPVPQEDGSPLKIHFIHEESSNPAARNLLLLHGWPGDFTEFLDVVEKLKGKYNIVIPSTPGYAFSDSPPLDRDFGIVEVAKTMHSLMDGLGYNEYIIQAGDWARIVAIQMGKRYPKSVKGILYNLLVALALPPPSILHHYFPYLSRFSLVSYLGNTLQTIFGRFLPDPRFIGLTAEEQAEVKRGDEFLTRGLGYQQMHMTRTSTIAHVVSASPIALLAWNGEKFLDWTHEEPSIDTILNHITLWWLTDTFASSIYAYRHEYPLFWHEEYYSTPTGYAYFTKEGTVTVPKSWVARMFNLQYYNENKKGGHFAAMEQPDLMAKDIEAFVAKVWA